MPIGKRVAQWLRDIDGPPSPVRTKASLHLLDISANYFDDNKVSAEERQEILGRLALLVDTPDVSVRQAVGQVTGLMRFWSAQVERILRCLLQDNTSTVQVHAVWACGHIGRPASPLVPDLVQLAEQPDREVRWRVPWALAQIACHNNLSLQCAVQLLKDDDPTVRMYALEAIGACTDSISLVVLDTVVCHLGDHSPEVSAAACRTLVALKDARDSTLFALRILLTDKDADASVTVDAVNALTKLDAHVLEYAPARRWLEANRGYWWVDDLLGNDEE